MHFFKLIALLALAAACAAAHADVFDDMKKIKPLEDPQVQIRTAYFRSIQNGQKPSIDSVRDFEIPDYLRKNRLNLLIVNPYFKEVLPYFFGDRNGEEFRWSERTTQLAVEQRRWCLDKKEAAHRASIELKAAFDAAPMGQYGNRVYPQAAKNRFDALTGGISGICMGVDPTELYGNKVWLSMQGSVKPKKGGF